MERDKNSGRDDAIHASAQSAWFDRHLGKIVVAAAIICGLGLVVRALSG